MGFSPGPPSHIHKTVSFRGRVAQVPDLARITTTVGAPFLRVLCVQPHDILYTVSLDILYTPARA
jgi:hypothetical protein